MKLSKDPVGVNESETLKRPENPSSGIDSVDLDVPAENGKDRSRKKWVIGAIAAAIVVTVVAAVPRVNHWMHYESTDDAFIEADITPMSPKIDGYVQSVSVNDNQHVKKGDVLVQIDPRDRQAKLDQAIAKLAASQAAIEESKANIQTIKANADTAQAEVDSAQADADYAISQANRYRTMTSGAASESERQNVLAAERSAAAKVAASRSRLLAAQAQLNTAKAQLSSSIAQGNVERAAVALAELELSYTKITAPVDGLVTKKNVQPGAYLQPGQRLLAIVPDEVWVVANFKETQLEHMEKGQYVSIRIDAYPDQDFEGKVDSIQSGTGSRFSVLPPENATGNYVKVVQRVPVKIMLNANQSGKLLAPGMSVQPEVKVK